jgi:predicted RNA-binding Zn-ribbon protein involved in translation (DUF1610 family)
MVFPVPPLSIDAGIRSPVNTMSECNHCGAHVSERFARVFADEHGDIYACPSCSANAGIAEVARQRARRV